MDEIVPNWAKQLIADVSELKNQISKNCTKLDDFETKLDRIDNRFDRIDNKLNQLQEIGNKNQNSINELIKLNHQTV